jgi:RNA polymerase sigma factor (sigma-70 family)
VRHAFPSASWTLAADASPRDDRSAAALDEFAERYYTAVRAFIGTASHRALDADDLTQRFFLTVVLSRRLLERADPRKGSFPSYLKQAIRNFLADERRRTARALVSDVRPDAGPAAGTRSSMTRHTRRRRRCCVRGR